MRGIPLEAPDRKQTATDRRFQFGANWRSFLDRLDEARIADAEKSLNGLLSCERLDGVRFLDIGSGSGLSSLAARRLGARVVSFDYDPQSVNCTTMLRDRFFPRDPNWRVERGSILDSAFLRKLGQFDVVYSWGVLHHTGAMREAIENATQLVAPGGALVLALYQKTPLCWFWTLEKQWYCRASERAQALARALYVGLLRTAFTLVRRDLASYVSNYSGNRGMDFAHDVHDWLGGYPYESIRSDALDKLLGQLGFRQVRAKVHSASIGLFGSGCNEYVYGAPRIESRKIHLPAAACATPRVTIVTSRLDIGGAERHLTLVLPALKRRGIEVTLYAMERGGALESELMRHGIRIDGPQRAALLHWPRATLALAGFLRRERPDIVHFFLPRPYLFGSIAAELAGHRRRLMSRRSLAAYQQKYPLLRAAERFLHRRTIGLIGNSQAVVEELATEAADPRKLALIHNGIETPPPAIDRLRTRQALHVEDNALVIVVIANLIPYKGHRDLIDALGLAKDGMPKPWRALVIGRDQGIGEELKQRAEALDIAANMIWLGEQAAAERLLAAGDIFVLPSHEEGFSNALLEAMVAELAVIATTVGGNRDAVVADESGILVPPRDPRALAVALKRLAGDPALRRRLGEAARVRVEQRFSLETCVARYERLYRAVGEQSAQTIAQVLAQDTETPA